VVPSIAQRLEREELLAWLNYTSSVWEVNEQRVKQFVLASSNGAPMPPPECQPLKDFMKDVHDRNLLRASTKRHRRIGMYCFKHNVVGDFVMHRRQQTYEDCGICVSIEARHRIQKTVTPEEDGETGSSSSSSSSSSTISKTAKFLVPNSNNSEQQQRTQRNRKHNLS
jgi:hypothetical protein